MFTCNIDCLSMSLPFFLASRFYRSAGRDRKRRASKLAIYIAAAGVAVGLAVMIISICVVKGFQNELRSKLSGFTAHVEVLDVRSFASPESYPIYTPSSLIRQLRQVGNVQRVQRVSLKMGILKTDNAFQNIVLKGVGKDYDLTFIKSQITRGRFPDLSGERNEILISKKQASDLGIDIGSKVYAYFFSDDIRMRRFVVTGIYETNFEQFDDYFVWTDRATVNKLNGWTEEQSSDLEVYVKDFNYACEDNDPMQKNVTYDYYDPTQQQLVDRLKHCKDPYGGIYNTLSMKKNPRTSSVIQWVSLLDMNVWIILGLMGVVAGFTMISGLLILILERTQTIGVLKALGATNSRIRQTFIIYASLIVVRGLFWGNVLGLGLVVVQKTWGVIKLNPATYHVAEAPVHIDPWWIAGLNIGTLLLCVLALLIPSLVISRIRPAKSIRFE